MCSKHCRETLMQLAAHSINCFHCYPRIDVNKNIPKHYYVYNSNNYTSKTDSYFNGSNTETKYFKCISMLIKHPGHFMYTTIDELLNPTSKFAHYHKYSPLCPQEAISHKIPLQMSNLLSFDGLQPLEIRVPSANHS